MPKITEQFKKSTSLLAGIATSSMELLLAKAKNAVKKESYKYHLPRKSIIADYDEGFGYNGLFKEKASLVSFDVLRQVAEKDMIVRAIIGKFCNRIAAFAQPQKNKYSLGFIVRPNPDYMIGNNSGDNSKKQELDETDLGNTPGEGKLSDEQKQEISKIINFLMKTGDENDERPIEDRKGFETFLRIITNDRLIYNQIGIECIPTKDGSSISYFVPVSGGTIRYSSPRLSENDNADQITLNRNVFFSDEGVEEARRKKIEETNPEDIRYVQVYRGQIYASFTAQEFIFRQGIPSCELIHQGYAPGELEYLLNTVANHRIAESHNESFFKFGYANNGILNIKSELTQEDLEAIKRQFQRQYQGTKNAFKMPIMSSKDGLEWIQTGQSNKDMEWSGWVEYLIKVITGVFGISPSEINFDIAKGSTNTIGDGGQRNEIMLRDTRNSMLRPLLRWIESIINDDLLPRYDTALAKKYIFEFVGLENEDKDAELNRIEKQVKNYRTINEIRKEEGLDSLKDGDIILDSNYLTYIQRNELLEAPQQNSGDEEDEEDEEDTEDKNNNDESNEEDDEDSEEIKRSIDLNLQNLLTADGKKGEVIVENLKKSIAKKSKTPRVKVEWYGRD